RQICINNLSIRRAIEELRAARDYDQLHRVLMAAFSSNDFDGFDLRIDPTLAKPRVFNDRRLGGKRAGTFLRWRRPDAQFTLEIGNAWKLTLELVSSTSHYCGSMIIYRAYSERDLQLDVNLLTSVFPTVLANALARVLEPR